MTDFAGQAVPRLSPRLALLLRSPGPVPARAGRPGQLTALPNGLLKHQHAPRRGTLGQRAGQVRAAAGSGRRARFPRPARGLRPILPQPVPAVRAW